MESQIAQEASEPQPRNSPLTVLPSQLPHRSSGSDAIVSKGTIDSLSDFEISTTSASGSSEEDVSTQQNSIDDHVAAIIRARKAIRNAIDRGRGPVEHPSEGSALASAEALIRARQLLRHEKGEKKDTSAFSSTQSSNHAALTAPNVSKRSGSGSSDVSDTSSTENTEGSSVSNEEPPTSIPFESSNSHPEEVVIVVPTAPVMCLGDDRSVANAICPDKNEMKANDLSLAMSFKEKLDLADDVESTSSNRNDLLQQADAEYWGSLATSYESISISPSVVEKVSACIDQVASPRTRDLSSNVNLTQEPALPENPSLTTTESLDSVDPEVLKVVSLRVRDLIDDLPQYQQRPDENVENITIPKDMEMPTDFLVTYLSSQLSEPMRRDPPQVDDLQSGHVDNDPPMVPKGLCVAHEVEINPKKDLGTFDGGEMNSTCDPEVENSVLYDELGELNTLTPRKSILSIDFDADQLMHIESEMVNESPSRRVTLLTIPNILEETDHCTEMTLEADGQYPAHRDFTAAVCNLYVLLSGVDDATEQDVHLFGQLIRYSFSFMKNSSDLSAFADSQILTRARELNVSMVLVDRYLDTIHSMYGNILEKYDDLESLKDEALLVQDLCAHIEVESDSGVELNSIDPNVTILNHIVPTDGFEIEANNGFVSEEYRPTDGEEPWWQVAARLNGTPCLDEIQDGATNGILTIPSDCGVINEDEANAKVASEMKANKSTVENDISEFWNGQKEARRLETEKLKEKGFKLHRTIAHDERNIGKASTFSHKDSSKRHGSLTASKTWSGATVSSIPQLSKREIQRKWTSKLAMADGTLTTGKLISAVDATMLLQKKSAIQSKFPFSNVWRNSYEKLTENHVGYFDVDIYSLYASTVVGKMRHTLDNVPWESRSVKQRFLYEQSLSFTRNWFGCLTATKLNTRIKEPVCRPKSMEMPMEADEWTEEWFRLSKSTPEPMKMVESLEDSDDDSWEDAPECGKIKTMRLRPGERISRVTPDLTCYLRRSRWRKKHFPDGNFPYT